jgi:hypothetical protein
VEIPSAELAVKENGNDIEPSGSPWYHAEMESAYRQTKGNGTYFGSVENDGHFRKKTARARIWSVEEACAHENTWENPRGHTLAILIQKLVLQCPRGCASLEWLSRPGARYVHIFRLRHTNASASK